MGEEKEERNTISCANGRHGAHQAVRGRPATHRDGSRGERRRRPAGRRSSTCACLRTQVPATTTQPHKVSERGRAGHSAPPQLAPAGPGRGAGRADERTEVIPLDDDGSGRAGLDLHHRTPGRPQLLDGSAPEPPRPRVRCVGGRAAEGGRAWAEELGNWGENDGRDPPLAPRCVALWAGNPWRRGTGREHWCRVRTRPRPRSTRPQRSGRPRARRSVARSRTPCCRSSTRSSGPLGASASRPTPRPSSKRSRAVGWGVPEASPDPAARLRPAERRTPATHPLESWLRRSSPLLPPRRTSGAVRASGLEKEQ